MLRFRGDVRLAGHHGMLLVRLLDPWITFTSGSGVLSISNGDDGGQDRTAVGFLSPSNPATPAGSWSGTTSTSSFLRTGPNSSTASTRPGSRWIRLSSGFRAKPKRENTSWWNSRTMSKQPCSTCSPGWPRDRCLRTRTGPDFRRRVDAHLPDLALLFHRLYGSRTDWLDQLTALVQQAARSWEERPAELKALDAAREQNRGWFLSNQMLGGVCYVDRYAGNLDGVRDRIPYFKELGLTYLHLMPLF